MIALFVCLMPFSAMAETFDLIAFKDYMETKKKDKTLNPEKYIKNIEKGFVYIDEELRAFVDPTDFEYVKENSRGFYLSKLEESTLGYYDPDADIIALSNGMSYAEMQMIVHHETQHLKDFNAYQRLGYDKEFWGVDLGPKGNIINSIILEARAYSEQAVFVYEKMEKAQKRTEEYDTLIKENEKNYKENKIGLDEYKEKDKYYRENHQKYEDEYEEFNKLYNTSYFGFNEFREAIASGKDKEGARHVAAVAVLNNDFFIKIYMSKYENKIANDTLYISPEYIIEELLNDGKFTVEDFYAADEKFYWTICQYYILEDTDMCTNLKKNWIEKHCKHIQNNFCEKIKVRISAERSCAKQAGLRKKIKIVSEEERTKNTACCSSSWNFPLNIFDD